MDFAQQFVAPGLVGVFALFTWIVKNQLEQLRAAQERLAGERRKLYTDLLLPYFRIFGSGKNGPDLKELEAHITSLDYRRTSFEVVLIGSDEVVSAYNDLMQYFYHGQPGGGAAYESIRLYGVLLLAIRKSLGNSTTKLDEWDMLRHMVNDLDKVLGDLGIETAQTRRVRRQARAERRQVASEADV